MLQKYLISSCSAALALMLGTSISASASTGGPLGLGVEFIKVDRPGNQLTMHTNANNTTLLLSLNGSVGDESAGYVSAPLDISPRQVFVTAENISKSSLDPERNDSQVSISFQVSGNNGISANVNFVIGPLEITGWFRGDLYERITPGSRGLLNLEGLTPLDSYSIRSISIIVQRNSIIEEMNLALRFIQ